MAVAAVPLRDVRCPAPRCGRLLFKARGDGPGPGHEVEIKCKCGALVIFEKGKPRLVGPTKR